MDWIGAAYRAMGGARQYASMISAMLSVARKKDAGRAEEQNCAPLDAENGKRDSDSWNKRRGRGCVEDVDVRWPLQDRTGQDRKGILRKLRLKFGDELELGE